MPRVRTNLQRALGRRSVERLRNLDVTPLEHVNVSITDLTLNLTTNSNLNNSSFVENPDWYKNIGIDNSSEMVHVHVRNFGGNNTGEPILPSDPGNSIVDHSVNYKEIAEHLESSVMVDATTRRNFKRVQQKTQSFISSDVEEEASLEFVKPLHMSKHLLRHKSRKPLLTNKGAFDDAFNDTDPESSIGKRTSGRDDNLQISISGDKSLTEVSVNGKKEKTSPGTLDLSNLGKGLRRRRLRGTANPNQEAFDEALDGSDPAPSMSDSNSKRNANIAEDSVELETSIKKSRKRSAADSKNIDEIDTSRDALELSSSGKGLRRRRLRGTAIQNQEAFDEALDGSDTALSMSDSNSVRNANIAEDSVELETSIKKPQKRSAADSKNTDEIDTSRDALELSSSGKGLRRRRLRGTANPNQEAFDEALDGSDPAPSMSDSNSKRNANIAEDGVELETSIKKSRKRSAADSKNIDEIDTSRDALELSSSGKGLRRRRLRGTANSNQEAFDEALDGSDPAPSMSDSNSKSNANIAEDGVELETSIKKSRKRSAADSKNIDEIDTSRDALELSSSGKGLRRRRLRGTANPNQEAFDEALDGSDPAPSMSDSNSKRNANIAEDSVELETSIKKSRKRSAADSKNIDEIDTSRDALELSSSGKGLRRRRLRGTANPNQEAFDEALDGSDPAPSMSDSNSKRNANTAEDSVELETSPTKSGGRSAANSKNLNEIDNLDNPAVNSDVPGQSGLVISLNGKDKYKAKVKKVSQSLEKSYTELESSLSSSPSRVRDQAYISVSARSSLMPSGSVHLEKSVSVSLRDELAEDGMNITGELSGSNHPYSEPAGGTLLPRKNLHSLASSGNYSDDFPDSDQVSSVKFNMQSNLNDRDVLATSIVALENYVSDVEPLTNVSAETNIQANRSVPSLKTSANHISSSVRKPIQSDKAESLNAVGLCEETTKLIQVDLKRWLIQQKEALKVKTVSSMTMTTDPVVFKKPKQPVGKEVKKVDSYFGDYRPPKKVKPRPYVTNNMYNFIERKLAAQYGIESRLKAEAFVTFMCGIVDTVIKRKSKYHGKVDELRDEMLKLDLISTQIEFHVFIEKYLPPDFRFKAIPCFGCDLGPPSIPSKDLYKPLRK